MIPQTWYNNDTRKVLIWKIANNLFIVATNAGMTGEEEPYMTDLEHVLLGKTVNYTNYLT